MIEAGAPSTGGYVACSYGVPAPPGVVMVSPPTTQVNASRAQSEGRAGKARKKRGQGQYKGRSPKAPPEVLEELR
jgi:hypothetical protein